MNINFKDSPKILNDFYNYLLSTKNYSLGTVEGYYCSVLYFLKFIRKKNEIKAELKDFEIFIILGIEDSDIIAFMIFLNAYRKNNAKTRNLRLSAIKTFFSYIYDIYSIYCKDKKNPSENIDFAYTTNRLPKYLSIKEAKNLAKTFNEMNSKYHIRNNLIIYSFLVTGLRKSELINLNINDIDFQNNTITIMGKGHKERIIFVTDTLKQKILEYIKTRRFEDLNCSDPLFVTTRNKRISESTIRYIVNQAYKLAGLENKQLTVHSLRHTAATIMYKKTKGDILIVKKFLGHSSIESTQIYTHIVNKELKKAYNANPLANYKVE